MKHIPLLITVGLLSACGEKAPTADASIGTASMAPAAAPIDLSSHGLPLLLNLPEKQLMGGAEPGIVWKDEIGTLEVRAGDHFGLMIREEPGDIPRLKAALDRDLLKKNTVLKETGDQLLFKSEFPDDPSLVFLHFYQVVTTGDRIFVVQDLDGQTFNQQDIERMLAAISPKPPA
jgi:hypothetical protein